MNKQHYSYLLMLNLGMLFVSTSGALGRYIALPPPLVIWCRALIAFVVLGIYCYWKKEQFLNAFNKNRTTIFLSGSLLTFHWVTYFFALQWSNVAIGMLSMFTYPVMTVFLEPLFFKSKLEPIHLLLGLLILLGVFFLVPNFNFNSNTTQGMLIGLVSALTYALRNIILKKRMVNTNGSLMMWFQMGMTIVLLSPVMLLYSFETVPQQLPYILILGVVTTALGHTLFLNSFKHFTIGTASIISSIQPIFGILIAMVFLGEIPHYKSLIGGSIILLTVIIESLRSKNR